MTCNVLVLHAYSADNFGDGLLVEESLSVVRQSVGKQVEFTVCASYPDTFDLAGVRLISSRPRNGLYGASYLNVLRRINTFDLVIAVGGGYLRAGSGKEAVKMLLVHGPQLFAASRTTVPVVYFPQSVGPLSVVSRNLVRSLLRRVDLIALRDDRSVDEVQLDNVTRLPDLAIMTARELPQGRSSMAPNRVPVLSVRPVGGAVPALVKQLATTLGEFDGFVQSETGSNRDGVSMAELRPRRILSQSELMYPVAGSETRVVVAVRLHAALMALRAGHLVIHLAYERKGFGAFQDLGLQSFVHNVNMFEPELVIEQVRLLRTDAGYREIYQRTALDGFRSAAKGLGTLVSEVSTLAGNI
ncbi:MAG: polysaccharide pyruvyl transferase family protein [Rhodococcus sp. (in: high G+C Gram-positive bacteria)]